MVAKSNQRLEIRLSEAHKALIQRAADLEGSSLAEFVRRSAETRARETIREHAVLTLTPSDSRMFVEALLAADGPNDALREAYAAYQAFIGEE